MEEEIISSKLTRFVEPLMKMDYDPERFIYIAMQSDPTRNKKYLPWILDSFINGGIKQEEDLLSRVYPALEDYETLKSKNILSTEEKDINRFCGLVGCTKKYFREGLEPLINKYRDSLEVTEIVDRGEYEEIYRDGEVRVIHPKDEKAACYYGQSTQWCTAATRGNNMFNAYNKDGPLYILIPQSPRYTGEKYQISFYDMQYMNEKDEDIGLLEISHRFPILIKLMKEGLFNLENVKIKKSSIYYKINDRSVKFKGTKRIYEKFKNNIRTNKYIYNGIYRREITYNSNGKTKWSEQYFKNDKLHRDDGPAKIFYAQNGSITMEEWFKDGVKHGPDILYNKDGSIDYEYYYKNGKRVTKQDYESTL